MARYVLYLLGKYLLVSHRAQTVLIRRDREIRIFGYFSFFMHARIISERDFQTIHLKIIMHKMAILCT